MEIHFVKSGDLAPIEGGFQGRSGDLAAGDDSRVGCWVWQLVPCSGLICDADLRRVNPAQCSAFKWQSLSLSPSS